MIFNYSVTSHVQTSESVKLALEYYPNFNTGLHVPRIQNEVQNIFPVSFTVLFSIMNIVFSISTASEVLFLWKRYAELDTP